MSPSSYSTSLVYVGVHFMIMERWCCQVETHWPSGGARGAMNMTAVISISNTHWHVIGHRCSRDRLSLCFLTGSSSSRWCWMDFNEDNTVIDLNWPFQNKRITNSRCVVSKKRFSPESISTKKQLEDILISLCLTIDYQKPVPHVNWFGCLSPLSIAL